MTRTCSRPRFGVLFATALAIAATCAAGDARVACAQSAGDLADARRLFEEGLAAARESRWQDARSAFERSLEIVERPSILLNLAGAQAQTGQLVDAAASYRRFLEIARGRDARHRTDAEAALRALEARIPRVTLDVDGLAPGDELRIDDQAIEADALGAPLPLDPGAHVATVTRDDAEAARARFELREGEQRAVALVVRDAAPEPTAMVISPDAPATDTPPGDDGSVWIWVGVGIGVAVAAAVGIGVGVAASSSGEPAYYMGNLGDGMIRF